ncbi:hypothetical protein [Bifidobacterium magnum]|uniref:Alcohol dehydrogenase n=1 Tax=Bifidobacterium magnum TaxID=1692 RepID=A0A087BC42_9BIFI|nr:hypothetical protein [Bifidobacterium magnum]KFI68592.1 hypothetical protein BMAGN_0460 [Bifidobacterium magnum]
MSQRAYQSTSAPSTADVPIPWSHRQGGVVKLVITVLAALASTFVGTIAQRMGASANIPYGLALAWLLVGMSAWCARSRMGGVGLAIHLIVSSMFAYFLANFSPLGDVLVPLFATGDLPFFSKYASLFWLFGMVAVQVVVMILPSRCFEITPRDDSRTRA